MSKILVVDDEPSLVTLLTYNLENSNYEVTSCNNGVEAVDLVQNNEFDFILMDLMLPRQDGLTSIKKIRQFNYNVPILILTAKSNDVDKIIGLENGADDYLTKPFSPQELLSRIKTILRRTTSQNLPPKISENKESIDYNILKVSDIIINLDKRHVFKKNERIIITPNEFEILRFLFKHTNQVVSREQIVNKIWGYDFDGNTRTVDMHISHLRDKLEDDPKHPTIIKTIRGFGYEIS